MSIDPLDRVVRAALEATEITVAFQPICDLHRLQPVTWWEALVRYDSSVGSVTPVQIVRSARRQGLLDALSRQIANQAFDLLTALRRIAGPRLAGRGFSINLEASQLATWTALLDWLVERSRTTDIEVLVEVTERELDAWTDEHAATIDRLRSAGVLVAIDDFGTGYAALGSLFRVPADVIKIDRSMTESLTDPRPRLLFERIISALHELGYILVVEGATTEQDLLDLAQLGVELVQSHLLTEPMPPEAVLHWAKDASIDIQAVSFLPSIE